LALYPIEVLAGLGHLGFQVPMVAAMVSSACILKLSMESIVA
jgi:hypothetical protein